MNRRDYMVLFLASTYILLLPLAPSTKIEWSLSAVFMLIGIIYLLELLFIEEIRVSFKRRFIKMVSESFSLLFIAFILIMAFSILYSENKIIAVKETFRFVYYGLIYFIIRFRFDKVDFFSILVKVYMLGTLIVSSYGIYDFIINFKKGQPLQVILLASRVRSTLGHPNAYGAYLILAIFPALFLAMKSQGRKKVPYIVLSLLLGFNIVATFSRNAWIALAIGILLLSVAYSWKFLFLYSIPALFALMSPYVLQRLKQLVVGSNVNDGRIKLWKTASKMIKDHTLLGVGSGNFIVKYKEYAARFPELKILEAETLPPHNNYIKVFSELGLIGIVTFLLLCGNLLKNIYFLKEKCDGVVKNFYMGYLISVVCFFIMNFFDDLFFVPKVTTNFILFVSISYSINSIGKRNLN